MLKVFIKRLVVGSLELWVTSGALLSFYNFMFENGGAGLRSFIIRNVKKKPANYLWTVHLFAGKKFQVFIDDTWKSWQFAINYRWIDIGQSKAEQIINDFYPGDETYIDIGANLGLRTMYAASINRKCILFEPNKSLNDFTEKQYAINHFTNYVIENYCLSDKPGKATFYISGSSYMSSLNKNYATGDNYGGLASELSVELIRLDDYLAEHDNIKPCLIKVDAEGHDFEVLKGAINTLKKFKPSVVVEVNSPEKADIIAFMQQLGYKYYGITFNAKHFLTGPEKKQEFDKCLDILFISNSRLNEILLAAVNK